MKSYQSWQLSKKRQELNLPVFDVVSSHTTIGLTAARGKDHPQTPLAKAIEHRKTIVMKLIIPSLLFATTSALSRRQLVVPEVAGTVTTCGPCEADGAPCTTCDDVGCGEPASVPCAEIGDWAHKNREPDSTILFETHGGQRHEYTCGSCDEGTKSYQCTECQTFPVNHCVLPEVHECGKEKL